MKIKDIRAVAVNLTPEIKTEPRVARVETDGFTSPMARYPEFKRGDWAADWTRLACVVTAEDGTVGIGTDHAQRSGAQYHQRPVGSVACRAKLHCHRETMGFDASEFRAVS